MRNENQQENGPGGFVYPLHNLLTTMCLLSGFYSIISSILRLARYNSSIGRTPKNFFTGLPCPAAIGMIATSVLLIRYADIDSRSMDIAMLLMVYGLSYLMVSTHKYNNSKHVSKARTFWFMVFMVLLIMVVATEPQVTYFFIGVLSILSGPLAGVYRMFDNHEKNRNRKENACVQTVPAYRLGCLLRITL